MKNNFTETILVIDGGWRNKYVALAENDFSTVTWTTFKNSSVNTSGLGNVTFQNITLTILNNKNITINANTEFIFNYSKMVFSSSDNSSRLNLNSGAITKILNSNLTTDSNSRFKIKINANSFLLNNSVFSHIVNDWSDNGAGIEITSHSGFIDYCNFTMDSTGNNKKIIDISNASSNLTLSNNVLNTSDYTIAITGYNNFILNNSVDVIYIYDSTGGNQIYNNKILVFSQELLARVKEINFKPKEVAALIENIIKELNRRIQVINYLKTTDDPTAILRGIEALFEELGKRLLLNQKHLFELKEILDAQDKLEQKKAFEAQRNQKEAA